jgi:hypothetical protein
MLESQSYHSQCISIHFTYSHVAAAQRKGTTGRQSVTHGFFMTHRHFDTFSLVPTLDRFDG